MSRGRKKTGYAKNDIYAIRITKAQKKMLKMNPNIKKELNEEIMRFLELYTNPFKEIYEEKEL